MRWKNSRIFKLCYRISSELQMSSEKNQNKQFRHLHGIKHGGESEIWHNHEISNVVRRSSCSVCELADFFFLRSTKKYKTTATRLDFSSYLVDTHSSNAWFIVVTKTFLSTQQINAFPLAKTAAAVALFVLIEPFVNRVVVSHFSFPRHFGIIASIGYESSLCGESIRSFLGMVMCVWINGLTNDMCKLIFYTVLQYSQQRSTHFPRKSVHISQISDNFRQDLYARPTYSSFQFRHPQYDMHAHSELAHTRNTCGYCE